MSVAHPRKSIAWIAGIIVSCIASVASAASLDTIARQAVLIDMSTGTTLFEKNAHQRMATSSMSKIMTMYMVFERIKAGRLSLDDTMPVSQRAWRMQGSKMFTELNAQIKVEDLIKGVIIQSGNDASVVLAEGLVGLRGGVRGRDDQAGPRAWHGRQQLQERDRLAGRQPLFDLLRSGAAGAAPDQGIPGILPLLFRRPNSPITASSRATATRCSTAT